MPRPSIDMRAKRALAHMGPRADRFCRSLDRASVRLGCAVAIAALILVATKALYGFVFESSDDYAVLFCVAGYYTGQPYPEVPFMNSLFTGLFCWLYSVNGSIPWYGLYFLFIQGVSIAAGAYSMISLGIRTGIRRPWLLAGTTVLCLGLFVYPMHRLQFTAAAAMAGAAAVGLLLAADRKTASTRENTVLYLGSAVLLALSYLQRSMSGAVALVFWLSAACYRVVHRMLERRPARPVFIRLIGSAALLGAVLAVIIAANSYSVRHGENAEFIQSGYNSYRATFQDYIRPNETFDDVREIAESVGWDRDMWDMLYSMFYFDSRWNQDSVRQFVDAYYASHAADSQPLARQIPSAVHDVLEFVRSNPSVQFIVGVQLASLAIGAWAFALNRRDGWPHALASLGSILLVLGLLLYLALSGRLILRSGQAALFPASLLSISAGLNACSVLAGSRQAASFGRRIPRAVRDLIPVATVAALLVATMPTLHALALGRDGESVAKRCLATIETYAIAHPDLHFIYDFSFGGDPASYYPFTTYDDPPTNLIPHGGWLALTSVYEHQLELNDLSGMDATDFLRDDVLFLTRDPKANPKRNFHSLLTYLDHMLGGVYAETVEVLPDEVYAIRFRPLKDAPDALAAQLDALDAAGGDGTPAHIESFSAADDGSIVSTEQAPSTAIAYWLCIE